MFKMSYAALAALALQSSAPAFAAAPAAAPFSEISSAFAAQTEKDIKAQRKLEKRRAKLENKAAKKDERQGASILPILGGLLLAGGVAAAAAGGGGGSDSP